MPNCRNCGARITKFDKDICPVCGTKNPLQGVSSETVEITTQIDVSKFQEGQKAKRRRKTMLLLFILIGFLGVPFFYLKEKKKGIIYLIVNLIAIAAIFSLTFFILKWLPIFAILAPIGLAYIENVIVGLIYYFLPDLKDGDGEFVS